jgi:hypothetical protein
MQETLNTALYVVIALIGFFTVGYCAYYLLTVAYTVFTAALFV